MTHSDTPKDRNGGSLPTDEESSSSISQKEVNEDSSRWTRYASRYTPSMSSDVIHEHGDESE